MIKDIIVYFIGAVLLKAGSIVLLPIFVRYLDPGEYGALEILNRTTDILLLCLFLNGNCLAAITFYNQAKTDEQKRRVAGSALMYGAFCVGLLGSCSLVLAGPIASFLGVGSADLVRLAFLAALADAFVLICLTLIQARVESWFFSAVTLGQLLLRLSLIAPLVCWAGWGIRGILLGSLSTSAITGAVLVVRELKRSGLHVDPATFRHMAWFALPFLPAGFCGLLLGTGDQFFLLRYADTAEIGVYALGYKLAMMVNVFTRDPFYRVWGARMHPAAAEPDAPRIFGQVFTRFTAAYLWVGLGLVLLGDQVIAVLGSSRYAQAASYLAPLVLAYLFMAGTDLMDAAFFIRRRTGLKFWITLGTTAFTLSLYLLLIPRYKAMGAAYATLAGFAFRLGLTYVVSQRVFKVQYEWSRLASMLAAAVGCWLLARFVAGPAWVAVPIKGVILLLFPAVLWATGQVTPWEKQVLAGGLERIGHLFGWRIVTARPAARET